MLQTGWGVENVDRRTVGVGEGGGSRQSVGSGLKELVYEALNYFISFFKSRKLISSSNLVGTQADVEDSNTFTENMCVHETILYKWVRYIRRSDRSA